MNMAFLCPNRKDRELESCTISIGMSVFNAVMCGTALMLISQKTAVIVTVLQISSYSFSHMHLFIAPRMSKSAVHHLWNLGRKWLNMVSTDTCTCIHQHYFSRVIVLSVCLKEDESSWWIYQFNGHQVKHCCLNPSDICCEDCIHEQLYCDSSDVTAYKRNFTTETTAI